MPTPPGPIKSSLGDRRLAAIVFTDVVGFSSLMEKDERHTTLLIHRDLKLIGQVCKKFGGDVLKNTGDGCLAAFPSVEAAVGSAMKIQRIIAEARQRLPPEEILHHRIGIHLGDVFFGEGDVLGNGVNIAARLLAEAEPDGICVSQTVYDLVKHRLDIKAVSIGARELKNIREAVQVYRVLLKAAAKEEGETEATAASKQPARKHLIIAGTSLLVLAAIGIGAWLIVRSAKSNASNAAATPSVAPMARVALATQPAVAVIPATQPAADLSTILQTLQRTPDYSADSAASWQQFRVFSNDLLATAIQGDAYVMTPRSIVFHAGFSNSPWGTFGDVTVQAAGTIRGMTASSWGIQVVAADGSHKLARAVIWAGGSLRVDLTRLHGLDEANSPLNPTDFSNFHDSTIHRGDVPNTLVMNVHQHKLSVLVNGQRMGTTWDITPVGTSRLVLIVEGNQGTVASFQRLKVWVPHPGADAPTDSSAHSDAR